MTTSPAAKAAATYAYGKPTYDGYSQPSTPGYKTTILQKQTLLDMHIAVDMAEVRGMTDIMTIMSHTVIKTTFRLKYSQSSKYQDDDREDYYSTPVSDPVSTGRYPSLPTRRLDMVTTPQATRTLMVVIRILDMIIVPIARTQRIIRTKEDDVSNK